MRLYDSLRRPRLRACGTLRPDPCVAAAMQHGIRIKPVLSTAKAFASTITFDHNRDLEPWMNMLRKRACDKHYISGHRAESFCSILRFVSHDERHECHITGLRGINYHHEGISSAEPFGRDHRLSDVRSFPRRTRILVYRIVRYVCKIR